MNSVTFNNTHYHLNGEMEEWCRTYAGEGGWHYDTPKLWTGMGDKVWSIHSMFGNTTFAFKEDKHYHWFLLRWSS